MISNERYGEQQRELSAAGRIVDLRDDLALDQDGMVNHCRREQYGARECNIVLLKEDPAPR